MNLFGFMFGTICLALSGCAAYEMPPLNTHHPANPQAAASTERAVSRTLAYTPEDLASVRSVTAAVAQEGSHGAHNGAANAQKTVIGEGKVVATVPSSGQLVVDHGEIKGFMDAMTMGYRVEPPSQMEGLKSGDRIRFTIDVPNKAIIKIERLK